MSKKVPSYLRTLRRQWHLTQGEVASLLPRCSRNRVSYVERNLTPPNAADILTYPLLFGLPASRIFPKFVSSIEEIAMQGAYELFQSLEGNKAPEAQKKRELLRQALDRATGKSNSETI